MLFRIRTHLMDRPGALAELAAACGRADVNILGLQIFPDLGSVTDELVLETPEGWSTEAVHELVGGAGGDEVSVGPCTTHELLDQPTVWLAAARDLVEEPSRLPSLLSRLLGEDSSVWTATEHVRAATLTELAEAVRRAGDPLPTSDSGAAMVDYVVEADRVEARIGGHRVGTAVLHPKSEVTVEVAPAWRRLGIGTALLKQIAAVAREAGHDEIVVLSPAGDEGIVPLLSAAGMRGLIKLSAGLLSARITLVDTRMPKSGLSAG